MAVNKPARGFGRITKYDSLFTRYEIIMRYSQMLIPTVKEVPADAEVPSHQLMIRAGIKNPQRLFKGAVNMENFPKRKSRKKYMALCPCGAKPRFTEKVETKIVTGAATYSCGKCKRRIKIGDIVYAETEKPVYPFIASISKE